MRLLDGLFFSRAPRTGARVPTRVPFLVKFHSEFEILLPRPARGLPSKYLPSRTWRAVCCFAGRDTTAGGWRGRLVPPSSSFFYHIAPSVVRARPSSHSPFPGPSCFCSGVEATIATQSVSFLCRVQLSLSRRRVPPYVRDRPDTQAHFFSLV